MKPRWLLFAVAVCCFTACPSDPGTRLDPGDDDPVDTDDEETKS